MSLGLSGDAVGLTYWGGGPGCQRSETVPCLFNGNVELPFGSPEYIGQCSTCIKRQFRDAWSGLGFFVMMVFLAFELFGTAFGRHLMILISALIVYAVSSILTKHGNRYVTGDEIDRASELSFLWTTVSLIALSLE